MRLDISLNTGASERIYGGPVRDLNLEECAMIDRRRLLGTGAASALALAIPLRAVANTNENRHIPSSGAPIPVVGMGTWMTFNVGSDPELLGRSVNVMRAFFEEGGGMIDSSPMYGSSQQTIGHGLAELEFPETLFSADKIWTSSAAEGPEQLAEATDAWRIDGFDLMQVHNLLAVDAQLAMLFERKAAGTIGYVGVTTSHGRRHSQLEEVMRRYPLDFVQLTYNVLDREPEARLLPLAIDRGIGVIVNRPFRRGALIRRTEAAPLPGFSTELGAETWAELMLKYAISHPAVTVAIPATTNPAHMRQNKRAARGEMPDADVRARIAEHVAQL